MIALGITVAALLPVFWALSCFLCLIKRNITCYEMILAAAQASFRFSGVMMVAFSSDASDVEWYPVVLAEMFSSQLALYGMNAAATLMYGLGLLLGALEIFLASHLENFDIVVLFSIAEAFNCLLCVYMFQRCKSEEPAE